MTPPRIYLAIAKRIDARIGSEFSCINISDFGKRRFSKAFRVELRNLYATVMCPARNKDDARYGRNYRHLVISDICAAVEDFSYSKAARKFRVLLLCMMAACYKDVKDIKI